MSRWRLTIEYDGGPFMGWQRQEHGPSAQQTLEEALQRMTGEVDLHALSVAQRHRHRVRIEIGIALLLAMACIWFPEEMGNFTGVMRYHSITSSSPPFLVCALGWGGGHTLNLRAPGHGSTWVSCLSSRACDVR